MTSGVQKQTVKEIMGKIEEDYAEEIILIVRFETKLSKADFIEKAERSTKLKTLRISKAGIDRIRRLMNRYVLAPLDKPPLMPGALKPTTTIDDLLVRIGA